MRECQFSGVLMERKTLSEQNSQESENIVAKHHEKRGQSDKIGRLKYNQFLLKRVLTEIKELRNFQRIILNGLKGAGYFHFDLPLIQKFACVDQADLGILEYVMEAGLKGVLPKEIVKNLNPDYNVKYYDVTRRIVRMNKRLIHEVGEALFEKRGQKWALTRFAFDVYGATEEEVARSNSVSEEEVTEL
jgi:hypothetical protein